MILCHFQWLLWVVNPKAAVWHSSGLQSCSEGSPTVLSSFEIIEIFLLEIFLACKIKNPKILLLNHTFWKNYNFTDLYSPRKKSTERPIVHVIRYTYILVDIYQGFRSSHRCEEIWSLNAHRPHSKNMNLSLQKIDFLQKVQSHISIMRGARTRLFGGSRVLTWTTKRLNSSLFACRMFDIWTPKVMYILGTISAKIRKFWTKMSKAIYQACWLPGTSYCKVL